MSYTVVDGKTKVYNPLTGEYRDVIPEVKKEIKVEVEVKPETKTEKKK